MLSSTLSTGTYKTLVHVIPIDIPNCILQFRLHYNDADTYMYKLDAGLISSATEMTTHTILKVIRKLHIQFYTANGNMYLHYIHKHLPWLWDIQGFFLQAISI